VKSLEASTAATGLIIPNVKYELSKLESHPNALKRVRIQT
jgi:hypothetical protein